MFCAVRLFCNIDSNNCTTVWYNVIQSYSKLPTCSARHSPGT